MAEINLPADSTTIVFNGVNFVDFPDGDTVTITFPNQNTSHTRSLRGVNIQQRSDRDVAEITLRVPKYSDEDETLTSWINSKPAVIIAGSIKENYTKDGEDRVATYRIEGASIQQQAVDTRNSTDGNNLMEYTIRANSCVRSL